MLSGVGRSAALISRRWLKQQAVRPALGRPAGTFRTAAQFSMQTRGLSSRCSTSMSAPAGRVSLSATSHMPPQSLWRTSGSVGLLHGQRVGTQARVTRPRSLVCYASSAAATSATSNRNAARLGLSTYQFPDRQPLSQKWLEACVQDVVKHLDEAPFLELVFPRRGLPYERFGVDSAVAHAPQLWRGIAQHVTSSDPEVVLLVSGIDLPSAPASGGPLPAEDDETPRVITGIALGQTQPHDPAWRSCPKLWEHGSGQGVLAGKVGDCCDGSEHGAHHSHSHQHTDAQQHSSNIVPYSTRWSAALRAEPEQDDGVAGEVNYWGVVVQSRDKNSTEGCYVLKTVRAQQADDCQCTHYSLTKVCQGDPLGHQLAAGWLP